MISYDICYRNHIPIGLKPTILHRGGKGHFTSLSFSPCNLTTASRCVAWKIIRTKKKCLVENLVIFEKVNRVVHLPH